MKKKKKTKSKYEQISKSWDDGLKRMKDKADKELLKEFSSPSLL